MLIEENKSEIKRLINLIAEAAHEINKAYCQAIGDESQVPWDSAPEWQKKSARQGVMFHLTNPSATPESSHQKWLEEKARDGWKYGDVKCAEKKEHPCFLPYSELEQEQRAKDYIFKQAVNSISVILQEASE